jgi:3-carboxy-cis,cis-muconate cycloisomerase
VTLVLSSQIFGATFLDPSVVELLSDEAYFRALLRVEVALARAQESLGIIPGSAAMAIHDAAAALPFDAPALSAGVLRDGVPMIALVSQLRAAVGPALAPFVHLGATSQDIMDTATVLGIHRALEHIERGLRRLMADLAALAHAHRASIMAARTHAQQALPTSFGLKAALWAAPLLRHHERLSQLRPRLCRVQLGGAAGTLAALGPRALEVVEGLARELGLGVPEVPWHTQRDAFAELGAWLALLTGSLGKLAQDVILLTQSEVGELREAAHGERGGSSSMPQKNNPMRSEQILAAARSVATGSLALQHALVQEHERGTHGWQVEWLTLSPLLMLTAGAVRNAGVLTSELQVDPARMRQNVMTEHGLVLSEAAVAALSAVMSRQAAQVLVSQVAARALREGRFIIDLLREHLDQTAPESSIDWPGLARPENHLGQADVLIDRIVDAVRAVCVGAASR